MMAFKLTTIFLLITISVTVFGQDPTTLGSTTDGQAFIISTTPVTTVESSSVDSGSESTTPTDSLPNAPSDGKPPVILKPEIYSFHINSDIRYRYARTYVTSRVVNRDTTNSQEVTFRVVLPETAFISKFIMEIDGKSYEAYVKEKEEAKKIYNQAVSSGQSAGIVELSTRNANVFDVNVNIKPQSKLNFNLTYEELLSRRLGRYEQSISISPDQVRNVKDFRIEISIEESQNFTILRVPNLRNDIELQEDSEGDNKDAIIERPTGNKAQIKWTPSDKDQDQLAKQGITGKFIVQYDIKRELDAGEVLLMNGFFVHFFIPENLPPLRKHVVFVLDTSGSMWGKKMAQLKEAMQKILGDLNSDDFFNIITFSSDVNLWSADDKPSTPNSNWAPPPFHGEPPVFTVVTSPPPKRQPTPATKQNIDKAKAFIESLVASGGTNIQDSIVKALNLTAEIKSARDGTNENSTSTTTTTSTSTTSTTAPPEVSTAVADNSTNTNSTTIASTPSIILPPNVESLIIFLTDGEPTVGVTDVNLIQSAIQAANKDISVPLFSLAFGEGADFPFVRKLSLQNNGFARKIYEAADATIQLKGFYNEIASPLLSNVTFNYTSPEYSIQNLTITKFATVFGGTEIAVAGIIVPKNETTTESPEEVTTLKPPQSAEVLEEVQVEGNQVAPTEKKYFDVVIGGFGRDGHVHFNNPEIFSSPIPWGVPITKPFPPRPTPAPTQEDLFLERLWAYLTIQQLIEKDLAKTQEKPAEVSATTAAPVSTVISTIVIGNKTITLNTTVIPETPRQKALRLALKYGFVTSLTSLVVVKPNSSDVTDAVAASGNTNVPDSMASPQSFNNYQHQPVVKFASRPAFTTANRIVPFPANANSQANYGIHPLIVGGHGGNSFGQGGSFGMYPVFATTTAGFIHHQSTSIPGSSFEEEEEDIQPGGFTPQPEATSTTPELEVVSTQEAEISTATATANLTLEDVTWYNESISISVNGSLVEYRIETNVTQNSDQTLGYECGQFKGHCLHLKDCLIPAILDDYKLYVDSYFCSITSKSSNTLYAGICCGNA